MQRLVCLFIYSFLCRAGCVKIAFPQPGWKGWRLGFSHSTGWKTFIVWSESARQCHMPECSRAEWFVLAWDEQTLILSLLHVSLESYFALCSLLALIRTWHKTLWKSVSYGSGTEAGFMFFNQPFFLQWHSSCAFHWMDSLAFWFGVLESILEVIGLSGLDNKKNHVINTKKNWKVHGDMFLLNPSWDL